MRSRALYRCLGLLLAAAAVPELAAARDCASLVDLQLPQTEIMSAEEVPAGNFVPTDPTQPPGVANLAFCRVAGVMTPSSDSSIGFEVWLPLASWNRKLMASGNSGLAGAIDYTGPTGLLQALNRGYAATGTDTGHVGSPFDTSWAIGHPEQLVDNGFRAMHLLAQRSRSVVRAFYGAKPEHAYLDGCSTGGRQGLLSAQRFPSDFDGIVAGAPPAFQTHVIAQGLWVAQRTLGDLASYIGPEKLPAIARAVLGACDALDGLEDGVLDDPRRCGFDPASLLCSGPETAECLTPPQADALARLYDGPRHPRTGRRIHPGVSPEASSAGRSTG